jgi:hypothetical protein
VVLSPLIVLRLATVAALVSLMAVLDLVPGVRNIMIPLLAHLTLTAAGFLSVNEVANDPRRTGLQTAPVSEADAFVVSQYQSPVDILVACSAISVPRNFVFPARDGRMLVVRRVLQALRVALAAEQPDVGNFDEIPADSVVYACGARTNGRGLLVWPAAVVAKAGKRRVGVLAVQYDAAVPLTTDISGLRYLVELLGDFGHVLRYTQVGGVAAEGVRAALSRVSGALSNEPVVETDLTVKKAEEFKRFHEKHMAKHE